MTPTEDRAFVFLDTNIFMHYRRPNEVDWCEVVGTRLVELLLAPVVVVELDKHAATHHSAKLRRRAKEIRGQIEQWLQRGGEIRPGVILKDLDDLPPTFDFVANNLQFQIQDHHLVGSILHFRASNPGERLVLVSEDLAIRSSARRRGFEAIQLDEKFRLKEEPDETEKKLIEAQQKLAQYETRRPELKLGFVAGPEGLLVRPHRKRTHDELRKELAAVLSAKCLPTQPTPHLVIVPALFGVSSEDLAVYESQVKQFRDDDYAYLQERENTLEALGRTLVLTLRLSNAGSVRADDVRLSVRFPHTVEVTDERPPELPDEPRAPRRPRGFFDGPDHEENAYFAEALGAITSHNAYATIAATFAENSRSNEAEITKIDKEPSGYCVSFRVKRVPQRLEVVLPALSVIYSHDAKITPLNLVYRAIVPEPTWEGEGKLDLPVQVLDVDG